MRGSERAVVAISSMTGIGDSTTASGGSAASVLRSTRRRARPGSSRAPCGMPATYSTSTSPTSHGARCSASTPTSSLTRGSEIATRCRGGKRANRRTRLRTARIRRSPQMATVSSETGPRACSIAYRSMSAWDGCSPQRPASPPFRKLLTSSAHSCDTSSGRPGRATTRSTLPLTTRRVSAHPSGTATPLPRRSATSMDCPPNRAAAAAKPTRVRRDGSRNSSPTSGGRVSRLAAPARRPDARVRRCRIPSVPRSSIPTITRFGTGFRP